MSLVRSGPCSWVQPVGTTGRAASITMVVPVEVMDDLFLQQIESERKDRPHRTTAPLEHNGHLAFSVRV
jgi:hypothetical protein